MKPATWRLGYVELNAQRIDWDGVAIIIGSAITIGIAAWIFFSPNAVCGLLCNSPCL